MTSSHYILLTLIGLIIALLHIPVAFYLEYNIAKKAEDEELDTFEATELLQKYFSIGILSFVIVLLFSLIIAFIGLLNC